MKRIVMVLIALISAVSIGQSKYEEGMQGAFDLWESGKQWEAANLFERISTAEQDNWLPAFYVAQINIVYSFGLTDEAKMKAQLDKSMEYINVAKSVSKDNPDIMVLEALYYTAWIAYDGQQYGMQYSPKVMTLYQKAAQIAPDNPNVVLSKAEWDIGSAKFFGQPTDAYCKDLQRAVELFTTFKPESKFHPNNGGDRVQTVIDQNCK